MVTSSKVISKQITKQQNFLFVLENGKRALYSFEQAKALREVGLDLPAKGASVEYTPSINADGTENADWVRLELM